MASYFLFQNVTAAQSAPTVAVSPPNAVVNPGVGSAAGLPSPMQQFGLVVDSSTTPGATVSASAQVYVSNDGVYYQAYGNPISAGSGAAPQQGGMTGAAPWNYFAAILTAISGAGARATLTMSA